MVPISRPTSVSSNTTLGPNESRSCLFIRLLQRCQLIKTATKTTEWRKIDRFLCDFFFMRNLIQCMGDMALMAIMCEKWPIFMWFLMFFWTFGVQMGPISFTRRPMNDYFIFGTLNPVCNNEKFDSMYGWYCSNAQNMWKIANFGWFLMIFWALWSPGGTPYPSPDTLWMIILSFGHSIIYEPIRNLIQCIGDMALMPKICENSQFWVIF